MKKRNVILLIVFLVTLLLDQITKMLASGLPLSQKRVLIPEFFSITYVQNTGAAWIMLEGKMLFFYFITMIALVLMILYFRSLREDQMLSKIGVIVMISGTVGNFVDRLFLGYVRDFLDFIIFGYDFPVFNVADMCLCIGIAFVILDEFINDYGVGRIWKKEDLK